MEDSMKSPIVQRPMEMELHGKLLAAILNGDYSRLSELVGMDMPHSPAAKVRVMEAVNRILFYTN